MCVNWIGCCCHFTKVGATISVVIENMVRAISQIFPQLVHISSFAIDFNSTPSPICQPFYSSLRKLPFAFVLGEILCYLVKPGVITFHGVICTLYFGDVLPPT